MPLDLPWDGEDLNYMEGSPVFLHGVDVYYDFSWLHTFGHTRAQFPMGQCAARQVDALCPPGKKPVLLLTERDDVAQGFFETPEHLVLVLQIAKYRNTPTDPVLSYLAGLAGGGIKSIGRLSDLAEVDPDDLREFLDFRLNAGLVLEWMSGREDRLAEIRNLPGVAEREVTVSEATAALESLDSIPVDAVSAIAELFGSAADPDALLALLRELTNHEPGRRVTTEVLGERTPDRIADARKRMTECMDDYQALLDDPSSTETSMQRFIEKNLWLLGLHYTRMAPQEALLGGSMDFALERVDGFNDVLELKSPHDPIVRVAGTSSGAAAPRPSAYSFSADLGQSLAQAHAYRDRLTRHAAAHEDLLGIRQPRDPWLLILIGQADGLPEHSRRVLTELNKSLHRVEVVPYDVLARRARVTLNNIQAYLEATGSDAQAA